MKGTCDKGDVRAILGFDMAADGSVAVHIEVSAPVRAGQYGALFKDDVWRVNDEDDRSPRDKSGQYLFEGAQR
jgi:hypothetical protein